MSGKPFDDDHDEYSNDHSLEATEAEIIKSLEPFHRDHDRLKEELLSSLPELPSVVLNVQEDVSTTTNRRAWIMKASSGLVAVVAVTVVVWLSMMGSSQNVAYGIEGLQERLLKVRSVHMKGWKNHWMFDMQNNRVGDKPLKLPMEQYFERPNRYFFTVHGFMPNKVTRGFSASDGNRQIQLMHDTKFAVRGKANPLTAELIVESQLQSELFGGFLLHPKSKYKKIDVETLQGIRAVVYEYDSRRINGSGTREKIWINSKTGFPVRMETFQTDAKTGIEELSSVYDQIKINDLVLPEKFPLQSPKGYQVQEVDFSKQDFSFGSASDNQTTISTRYGINIDNKAVLVCWMHDWRDPKGKPVPPKEPVFSLDYGGKSEPCVHRELRVDTIQGRNWHWALLTPKDRKFVIKNEALNSVVQKKNRNRFSLMNRPLRFSDERLKTIIARIQQATLVEGAVSENPITLEKLRKAISEVRGEKLL